MQERIRYYDERVVFKVIKDVLGLGKDTDRATVRSKFDLEPEFWQECQRRVETGEIVDFFPYPESLRFSNRALS